jgi:hypothetical protein
MLSTANKEMLIISRANLLGRFQKDHNTDRVHLPPGKHLFPVRIDLPASLPSSASLREGSITYKAVAEADIVAGTDLLVRDEFTIVNPNDLSSAQRAMGDKTVVQKSVNKSPMGAGGPIDLDVTVVKGAASLDEDFEYDIKVRNNSSRTLKKLETHLRRTVYTNGIPDDINGDTVHEWKLKLLPRILPGESYSARVACEMDELSGPAFRYPPSLKRGKYEAVYKLRVRLDIKNAADVYLDVPVRVCASDPSRPLALRRQDPAPAQMVATLPVSPRDWNNKMIRAWASEVIKMPEICKGLQTLNIGGWDLLGLKPEAFPTIVAAAGFSGDTALASRFSEAVDGLIQSHFASRLLLEGLSLGGLVSTFETHQVLHTELPFMTSKDMKRMGVPVGPTKRILRKIADMFPEQAKVAQKIPDYDQ